MTRAANPTVESDQEVAALLIAAKPKAAPVYRWRCCRCANPQETATRPPSPQLCARCRPIALEHATEPATRPVYGDESEDDGEPIERVWIVPDSNDPALREHIQSDTPPSEATVTATKETEMTATVALPVKAAEKKPDHVPDAGKKVAKPDRRPCGCRLTGRHLATCKLAPKEVPGAHVCDRCPCAFGSKSALSGHKRHCKGEARKAAKVAPEKVLERAGATTDLLEATHAQGARSAAPDSDFATLGRAVGELVATKQAAYGDSFGRSGAVLKILYPIGIAVEQYDDALAVVRVVDKLFRVATDRDALGESPWKDIAGYGLLGAARTGAVAK